MINATQFKDEIILPALTSINLYSAAAENLLLGTALVESGLTHIRQLGDGPALGFFQMEPETHNDIWENFLGYRADLANKVKGHGDAVAERLIYDMRYAAAMCRVHYLRSPMPLPYADDVAGMAATWKQIYNTNLGGGTAEKYIRAWVSYVEGKK